MICDRHNDRWRSSPVVSHIVGQVEQYCDGTTMRPDTVEELGKAVELFLEESPSGGTVDADSVSLLASFALAGMGEHAAARKLLLFGSGLVMPSEWTVTGDEAMWVLDLRQMTVRAETCIEIVFFRCLDGVLGGVADVWDASLGRGVLGLQHISASAAALMGTSVDAVGVECLADEVRAFCSDRLEQIAAKRGWVQTPRVLDLDIRI